MFETSLTSLHFPQASARYDRVLVELPFLPSLHFVARITRYETVILEQWEHYNKGSYRNKCVIHSNQGHQYLIVPLLKGKHQSQLIREVEISYTDNWIRKMTHRLQTEYGSLPYFQYYVEDLMQIVRLRHRHLFDLNTSLLRYIMDQAGQPFPTFSSDFDASPGQATLDLRDVITPAYFRKKPDLMKPVQVSGYEITPGHTIVEALFAYGPELAFLLPIYRETL